MIKFLKQTITNYKTTGAIAASSKQLCQLLVDTPKTKEADVIVEFGPGTGVVSEIVLETMKKDALFFAIEFNPVFVEESLKRCPNLIIYQDDALNLPKYLKLHEKTHCDVILSGLPWSLFEDKLQNDILQTIHDSLKPGGEFLTFAYIHATMLPGGKRFRKKIESLFSSVKKTKIIWKNAPPAFVYHCTK